MKNKENTKKNSFHLRVYNEDMLTSLHELMGTGRFDSMNDLLNVALERGIVELYVEYGKKKALEPIVAPENTEHALRQMGVKLDVISSTCDDIFVLMNVLETLTAMLFNVERAHRNGEPVSDDMLEQGLFAELPSWVEEVKDAARARSAKKKE